MESPSASQVFLEEGKMLTRGDARRIIAYDSSVTDEELDLVIEQMTLLANYSIDHLMIEQMEGTGNE